MKTIRWVALCAVVVSAACGGDGESDRTSVEPVSVVEGNVDSGGDDQPTTPAPAAPSSKPDGGAKPPVAGPTPTAPAPDAGTPTANPTPPADAGNPEPEAYCVQNWEGGKACTEDAADDWRTSMMMDERAGWSYQACPSQATLPEISKRAWVRTSSATICKDFCDPVGTSSYSFYEMRQRLAEEVAEAWGCSLDGPYRLNDCQCFPPNPSAVGTPGYDFGPEILD